MALEHVKVTVTIDKATALAAGFARYGETEWALSSAIIGQLSPAARALLADRGNRFPINRLTDSCDNSPANTIPLAAVPPSDAAWVALLEAVAGRVAARAAAEAAKEDARQVADDAAAEETFQAATRLPYEAIRAAVIAEVNSNELGSWNFIHALRRAGAPWDSSIDRMSRHAGLQALYAQHKAAQSDYCEAELAAARQREEEAKLTRAANALREQALIDRIICRASEAQPALMLVERYKRDCLPQDAVDAVLRDWAFLAFDAAFAPFKRLGVKDVAHGYLTEERIDRCPGEAEAMEYDTVAALKSERGLTPEGFVALTDAERLVAAANAPAGESVVAWAVEARLHVATCNWCHKEAVKETLYVTCTLPTGRVLSREYAAEARP